MGTDRESYDTMLRQLAHAPPVPVASYLAGERIGRYEVVRLLGRGGFGVVYEALDLELGRHVALKLVQPRPGGAPTFRREAAAVARLNHPNIVAIYDFGGVDDTPYLVLELLHGESLHERLARGRLPVGDALDIAIQIARGIAHAHAAGVIHGDLKPGNVLLRPDGTPKLVDFGLARIAGDAVPRGGTVGYMAPEQQTGDAVDARSDVFAVGVVLREMICGRDDAVPLPDALASLIQRVTAVEPTERPQTADELAVALVAARRELGDADDTGEPYRYLEQFHEAESCWFFGRDRETAQLERMIDAHPIVAIVGPSGAGKSSLVQAGLIPRWRARSEDVELVAIRPGARPLERLHAAGIVGPRTRPTLIVIDQLEELITHVTDPAIQERFLHELVAAARDRTRVVVGMRDDFLVRIAQTARFGDVLGGAILLLGPPDRDALSAALVGPARRLGFELEPGLCDEMIDAVAGETAPLPLLQLAASRLWERRDIATRQLTRAALERIGGVTGVLATHAEELLHTCTEPRALEVARELLRELVTTDGTRRPQPRDAVCLRTSDRELAGRLVDRFIAGRVLTASRSDDEIVVELSHEALITRWGRLARWLAEDSDVRRWRERIEEAAVHWGERGKPRELLWVGRTLEDALAIGDPAALPAGSAEFVRASAAQARRRRRVRGVAQGLVITVVMLAIGGLLWRVHSYREQARDERIRAIASAAAATPDPLAGALLLRELPDDVEPAGAASTAYRIALQPLPTAEVAHGQTVWAATFGRNGLVATGGVDRIARVWSPDGQGPVREFRMTETILSVALASDGRELLVSSGSGSVRAWRLDGAGQIAFVGHTDSVWSASYDPAEQRVLTASRDGTVRIWDRAGHQLHQLATGSSTNTAQFDPAGRRVVNGCIDGSVWIWEPATGATTTLRGHTGSITAVRFSPDGTRVASASQDGTVRVWPVAGGDPIVLAHRGPLFGVAWSPDGTRIASGDDELVIWDAATGTAVGRAAYGAKINFVTYSPDGTQIAIAGDDHRMRVVDASGRDDPYLLYLGGALQISFSRDGKRIVGGEEGVARAFTLARSPFERVLAGPVCPCLAAAMSRDRDTIAVGTRTGDVWLWRGSAPPRILHPGQFGAVDERVAMSADGSLLAVAAGHVITMWRDGEQIRTWEADDLVSALALSPLGDTLAIGTPRGLLLATGAAAARVVSHDAIDAIAFAPRGDRLVAGGATSLAAFANDGTPLGERHPGTFYRVAISPDGMRIAGAGIDPHVRVYAIDGGAIDLFGHTDRLEGELGFSPDSARLVTGSIDATARIWPLDGGAPIVLPHRSAVYSAAFTPDGARVVTGAKDGTLHVWDAATGRELLVIDRPESAMRHVLAADGAHALIIGHSGIPRVLALPSWPELLGYLRTSTESFVGRPTVTNGDRL